MAQRVEERPGRISHAWEPPADDTERLGEVDVVPGVQLVGGERQQRLRQAPTLEQMVSRQLRARSSVSAGDLDDRRPVSDEELTCTVTQQRSVVGGRYKADLRFRLS